MVTRLFQNSIFKMNKFVIPIGLFLCLLLCISSCFSTKKCVEANETNWIMSDSVVASYLDENLSNLLSAPDSVKCYSLMYKVGKETKGYMRDTLLAILDCEQIAILQYLLVGNPYSYKVDSMKIEAPYIPIIEYEFLKKDSLPASIIVSTSDRSWSLSRKGKKLLKNTYSDAHMIERFCDYFLNMRTLKAGKK